MFHFFNLPLLEVELLIVLVNPALKLNDAFHIMRVNLLAQSVEMWLIFQSREVLFAHSCFIFHHIHERAVSNQLIPLFSNRLRYERTFLELRYLLHTLRGTSLLEEFIDVSIIWMSYFWILDLLSVSMARIFASASISYLEGDFTLLVKNVIAPTIFFFLTGFFFTEVEVGCQVRERLTVRGGLVGE